MNQEEKRIKIAEACGLYAVHSSEHGLVDQCGVALPDYFEDLNAMKKAEDSLGVDDFHGKPFYEGYQSTLEGMVTGGRVISASAALRAEAFGRTLGLWREWE